jgi:hypothetical protein
MRTRFGTAHGEVLLKLTAPTRESATWNRSNGALYENRALTEILCEGLARIGFLDEHPGEKGVVTYAVNKAGLHKAWELRSQL